MTNSTTNPTKRNNNATPNGHAADPQFNRSTPTAPQREKLIPYALEAEQSTLGLMLHNPEAIGQALKKVCPNDFYSPVHRRVCSILISAHEKGELISETQRDTLLNEIGGAALTAATRGGNVESYAHDVFTASLRRQMIIRGQKITDAGYADDTSQIMPSLLEADGLRGRIQNGGLPNTPIKPQTPTGFNATELLAMEIPEPTYVIPGLLPQGYGFIGGPPKLGKSWLVLNWAIAVASGGYALGSIEVEQGDVLYLALEDTARRLKSRLQKILNYGDRAPERLRIETQWPRLDQGGLTQLAKWLSAHPEARLVIIDTLQKIRRPHGKGSDIYAADYETVEGVKRLADLYDVAILVVHHTTKMDYADPLQSISGTQGLTGAADSIMVLKRERGRADATLFITGRDVEEQEIALNWDASIGTWKMLGDAADYRLSEERKAVKDVLGKSDEPLTPKETADRLGKNHNSVKKLMFDMSNDGQIKNLGRGKYTLIGNSGNSGNFGNSGNSGNSGLEEELELPMIGN
jgi:hypothetical protein